MKELTALLLGIIYFVGRNNYVQEVRKSNFCRDVYTILGKQSTLTISVYDS